MKSSRNSGKPSSSKIGQKPFSTFSKSIQNFPQKNPLKKRTISTSWRSWMTSNWPCWTSLISPSSSTTRKGSLSIRRCMKTTQNIIVTSWWSLSFTMWRKNSPSNRWKRPFLKNRHSSLKYWTHSTITAK